MKRLLYVLFALILCAALTACSDGGTVKTEPSATENNIYEGVSAEDFLLSSVEVKSAFGVITFAEYKYDDKNNLIKLVNYGDGKVYSSEEFSYDESNYLTAKKEFQYNKDGGLVSQTEYTYTNSSDGFVLSGTQCVSCNGSENAFDFYYEYDDKDRVTRYFTVSDNSILDEQVYEYLDDNGSYRLLSGGSYLEYHYDSAGNEIAYTVSDLNGNVIALITKVYDAHNNLALSRDKSGAETEYTNTYDADRLTKVVVTASNGEVSTIEYDYDDYGNLTCETTTNSAGTVVSQTTRTWILKADS